jgi:L-alanine-DL-glutamate epimerase-like enolase superfamily enzyme
MKISSVNVYKITLPFQFTFSHSQKDARSVDNIVVEIATHENGVRGYGEGAPRPYVTGDTQRDAIRNVRTLCLNKGFPWDLDDISQIWDFIAKATGEKSHNSALCAIETALLDALANKEARNISYYLPSDHATEEIRYGGAIPIGDQDTVLKMCKMLRDFDINQVRLKMGRDLNQNRVALEAVRKVLGSEGDLRVDVNGAWDLDIAKRHLSLLELYGVNILEQPLPPHDYGWRDLAAVAKSNSLKFMADESICSTEEMEDAIVEGYFDIVNIRLSKCGGFLNSLKIIQRIREAGLDYQVGCQLGETGILSAAGRALCAASSDALYYDGSYDALLLKENLTTEHVTFGHGGKAIPLKGHGLGIKVNPENLNRFSDHVVTIER